MTACYFCITCLAVVGIIHTIWLWKIEKRL